ncbi:MAG: radical SAM protein [Polyangiaceae bacterium]
MLLELIAPAGEDSTFLPRMGLGILMARTPADVEIIYTDEVLKPFDLARDVKDVDLVGISVDSKTARRAYDIAAAYRRRNVKVVLGGIHPSACPEEALEHADAVVVGEADVIWTQVVEDFRAGRLQSLYRPELPDLSQMPQPRRDLFRSKRYIPFQVVQTMRGCPYPCEFCSVSTANGKTFRFRPVDHVIAELQTLGKLLLFADDNVMIHRGYSTELFQRMAPLKKHWIGQCSLATVRRIENVALMAKSGCKALFIGFESIDDATVRDADKPQNRPSEYREVVDMLLDHGISVWGSFVFGFDNDSPEVFDRTVEEAIAMKLTMASFALLTPYPATPLYRRLRAEGRLTEERWWLRLDHDEGSPYFVPKNMSREQLREGWIRAWQTFYAPGSIARRFTLRRASSWIQSLGFLPLNLMQNRLAHWKIGRGLQRHRTVPREPLSVGEDPAVREKSLATDEGAAMPKDAQDVRRYLQLLDPDR